MARTPAILTEPLMMFGVYVESFTSSVGYGAESSTMQMTLVEDPDNLTQKKDGQGNLWYWSQDTIPVETYKSETCTGAVSAAYPNGAPPCTPNLPVMVPDPITLKHSLDSGVTLIDGLPEVGTVCQFIFKKFEFVGIFQRYSYSESSGGRKYDVTFESPSKVLDGVQVILSGFEGTAFWDNPFNPSSGQNFTSQLNNVYNPFGIKENYAWGIAIPAKHADDRSFFGLSDYNAAGFPVLDGPAASIATPQRLVTKGLLTLIEEISKSVHTYDNPCGSYDAQGDCVAGPAPDTSFNLDQEELIGGPIHFGDSKFVIDFGDLKDLVPDFFRIKGPVKNINAILNECCELIVHDYISIIKSFNSEPDPNLPPIYRNGVVPIQLEEDASSDRFGDVIGPVISFKYLNKTVQPVQGVVAQLVEAARLGGTLISADNGREYADVVTQKLIIGDNATRVYEADLGSLIPVYGKDLDGKWLLGAGFASDDVAPVLLDTGGIYYAPIMELRCAMSGYETWAMYHNLGAVYGYSNIASDMYSSMGAYGTGVDANFRRWMDNTGTSAMPMTGFNGDFHKKVIQESTSALIGNEKTSPYFTAVLNTATKYWGKTYFVLLPVEPGGIDNNIRYKNDSFSTEAAWEIADAGWDPDFRVNDIDMYNDEGALKACAGYYPASTSGGVRWARDFGAIEKTVGYESPVAPVTLIGSSIDVDNKIYWKREQVWDTTNGGFKDDPAGNVKALVHITCPRVWEADAYATEKSAVDSLFAFATIGSQDARNNVPKMSGYRSKGRLSPGAQTFGNDSSNPATVVNMPLHLRMLPTAVRPFRVSIPQKSTRYNWGPWYRYSVDPVTGDPIKIGKAEVVTDSSLKPETFGGMTILSNAGFALAEAGTADLYAAESGSVELAELPEYNMADRIDVNGPYITKIDISVGTGGITTKYQFSTWTRNFGKIAKYNIDRIAKANKDRIKAMKQGSSAGGNNVFDSGVTRPQDRARVINATSHNFFLGLGVPSTAGGGAAANPYGAVCFDMNNMSGEKIHDHLGREVKLFSNRSKESVYDLAFGCTPEQIFSPIGVKKVADDGTGDFLPYIRKPLLQGGAIQENKDDTFAGFEEEYASPTAYDLDPYFFATSTGSKSYFGAVVQGTATDIQGGGKNMHFGNNRGKLLSASKEIRTFGLRGPLLLSGWGYDVVGYPVPGKGAGFFGNDIMENPANMKHGPVDLRWDEERQVWAGGLQFLEGILTTAVEPAEDDGNGGIKPNLTGEMNIRRKTAIAWDGNDCPTEYEWFETNEKIKITNRDPSLSVDPDKAEYPIYVMVTRINYEWRIVYISCDNFEVE